MATAIHVTKITDITVVEDPNAPLECPDCGAEIRGTVDIVPGTALTLDDGMQYIGETEMDWDSQKTIRHKGLPILECEAYHHFTHPKIKP